MAASNWADAPVNPRNAPAEDGTAAGSSGNGNCGPAQPADVGMRQRRVVRKPSWRGCECLVKVVA